MPDILDTAFRSLNTSLELSGSPDPYAFQTAVAEALLSGRRVVLRAPAGAGKTLAGWLPWLASRLQSYDFPSKMLHVLPGGTFFEGLYHRLETAMQPFDRLHAGIQTEGDAFDPFFLSDATITTVDHLLSVALNRPLGLHPGLSNLDAGAIFGSYLIFDGFPALQSRETMVLWLGLLRQYYPFTPCLFTTSVMPRPLAERMAEALNAEFIDASAFQVGGKRQWTSTRSLPLGPEAILRQHRKRTIVVCNTLRGAQTLYRALKQAMGPDTRVGELLLLHQYQFYRSRRAIEDHVAEIFGHNGRGNALLVTTSGIETGMDLTADTLITDPAPPDALLRRAGRCARFAGELGRVIVARVTEQAPGDTYPSPPWEALVDLLADEENKSSADELIALDAVWNSSTPEQQPAALRNLPADEELDTAPRQLISGADAFPERLFPRVGACLHRVPETVQDPFELERFSLSVSSLERGWRQWQASGCPGEWFALIPHWPQYGGTNPAWSLVENPREFRAAARLIVLNSEAVSYDPIIGLELSPGTAYQSDRLVEQHTTWAPFDQHMQSFQEHAARGVSAFELQAPAYRYALRHLARHWQIPAVELEQWLRLSILWHDAGKLTADWQRAAFRWQSDAVRRPITEGVLARVDFQLKRDGYFPCPDHAPFSGIVLSRVLSLLLSGKAGLHRATLAALTHHHGVTPVPHADLTPHPEAWATLMELAAQVLDERQVRRLDRTGWNMHLRGIQDIPARPPDDPDAWMAYSVLVRAIRLADREVAMEEILM
ncbi:MAG: DEAD/DEAH box helicase [Armatimonadota bacterium]